jgi:hypothetical protein
MLRKRVYGLIDRGLRGVERVHEWGARTGYPAVDLRDGAARRLPVGLVIGIMLLATTNVAAAQAEPAPVGVPGVWSLKLNEEFTPAGLNTGLWTPGWQHGGISGPMSGQCLSSSNVSQPGNGYLYLELKPQASTCEGTAVENTGALVESNPGDGAPGHTGFAYSYGYVEWRAYVPGVAPVGLGCAKGGCLPDWPALWSLPENHENEIDTMEGLGRLGQACYHFPPPFGKGAPGACLSGSYAGWHTYGAEWEPGVITYYYDGVEVGQITSSNANSTREYLVMDMVPPTDGQPFQSPDSMVIDYVRVWQHPSPPGVSTGAASEVQASQATLHGAVNPNGVETHYSFQYGETAAYELATPGS